MARRRGGPVNDPRTDARERTLLMLYEAEHEGHRAPPRCSRPR